MRDKVLMRDAEPARGGFRQAMQRLAGTVCLVTVADEFQRWYGMAATSVVSVSLSPPSLLACIDRRAATFEAIDRRMSFCVNILSHQHERHCDRFSRPGEREARFKFGEWKLHAGLPYLADAQAAVFCDVARKVDHGSHAVFIGNVKDVIAPFGVDEPLIYFNRGYLSREDYLSRENSLALS